MPCFRRFVVITLCQMDVYPVCTFGFGISFLSQETIHQCGLAYAVVPNKHASNEVIDVCTICQSLLVKKHSLKSKAANFVWCLLSPL